ADGRAQHAVWAHLRLDGRGCHIRLLHLKPDESPRPETIDRGASRYRHPHVDSAIGRILVAAPRRGPYRKAARSELRLAQKANQASQLFVAEASDVVRGNFKHGSRIKVRSGASRVHARII